MGRFLDAAEIVLRRTRLPLRSREITDKAIDYGLLDFSNGKTPHQTMKAKLSVNIKTMGVRSRFKRSGKGLFALREFQIPEYRSRPFQKTIRSSEDVLVFQAELLDRIGWFHGIKTVGYQRYASILLNHSNTRFIPRVEAETNLEYKQAISYVLIKKHDSLLRFLRGSYSSVQSFLKGRYCLGFGGHTQSIDFDSMPLFASKDSGYLRSLFRELNEELNLPKGAINDLSLRMIGILNDDTSFVGKVHFAFLHLLDLDRLGVNLNPKLLKKEKSINQLRFVPIARLGDEYESYEYWSKLCIKAFFKRSVQIEAKARRVRNFSLRKHSKNIVVLGSIGSGKTEASRLLQQRFGYSMISTSQALATAGGLPRISEVGRERFQDLGLSFIERDDGPTLLANEIYNRISASAARRCVIDGIRNVRTLELLKDKLGGELSVIFVESTPDSSYEFFKKRENRTISFDDFLLLLQHPVEREVSEMLSHANIVFYNHGSKKSYIDVVMRFFSDELAVETQSIDTSTQLFTRILAKTVGLQGVSEKIPPFTINDRRIR